MLNQGQRQIQHVQSWTDVALWVILLRRHTFQPSISWRLNFLVCYKNHTQNDRESVEQRAFNVTSGEACCVWKPGICLSSFRSQTKLFPFWPKIWETVFLLSVIRITCLGITKASIAIHWVQCLEVTECKLQLQCKSCMDFFDTNNNGQRNTYLPQMGRQSRLCPRRLCLSSAGIRQPIQTRGTLQNRHVKSQARENHWKKI